MALSATAAAIGARSSGTNGPCAARSSTTNPTGADVSVASSPAVAERTNTLWKRVSSTIERTADVDATSRIEKHKAAPSAAPHAAASCTSWLPKPANAIAAAVVATRRFETLNATLSAACRWASMFTPSPTAAAIARPIGPATKKPTTSTASASVNVKRCRWNSSDIDRNPVSANANASVAPIQN